MLKTNLLTCFPYGYRNIYDIEKQLDKYTQVSY